MRMSPQNRTADANEGVQNKTWDMAVIISRAFCLQEIYKGQNSHLGRAHVLEIACQSQMPNQQHNVLC